MQVKQPNLNDIFVLPNPGLRAYLVHVKEGNPEDYRPPFWKGKTREQVLSDWQAIYDASPVQSQYPGLTDFEAEMKSKVGPMSIQLPLAERLESIEAYYSERKSEPIDADAIKATIRYFSQIKGVRARSKLHTWEKMRKDTNSGNPRFDKRRNITIDYIMASYIKGGRIFTPDGDFDLVAVLGWRGQEGGIESDDVKQRVIWMMCFLLNIYELQFYQPAVEAVQKFDLIPAYVSMNAVDERVTKLFDSANGEDVICTDFTKFDQHFNPDMQSAAAQVEEALFTDSKEWIEKIFWLKFNVPLLCSEDIMYVGSHGMGSGSGGTNFDECMAHRCLQYEAAFRAGASLNPYSMAYGDDGILTYPGIKVEHIKEVYERHGQEMNLDKQMISKTDCVVLRRWHSTGYRNEQGIMVGVYSTFRALGRLLAQERFYDPESWGPEQVTLRAWSILENCNKHPLFEQFVDFCMKGDKYRLGIDIPGFIENVSKIAQESMDNMPDFLGFTKTQQGFEPSGIRNWRIYNYVRSKAKTKA
jgi:hypothetical protein